VSDERAGLVKQQHVMASRATFTELLCINAESIQLLQRSKRAAAWPRRGPEFLPYPLDIDPREPLNRG